jgi:hypothetical protein
MGPDFDDWLCFCFGQAVGRPPELDDEDAPVLDPKVLAGYLARLFEAHPLVDRFSIDQVGQGLWFICGVSSSYFTQRVMSRCRPTIRFDGLSRSRGNSIDPS